MSSEQSGGKRAPSAWTKFVTKFYHDKKKENPEYKFSQALKDAAKVYKKTGGDREDKDDEDSDMEGGKKKKKRTVRRKKTSKKKRTSRK